jgi:hypothetical protein
MIATVFRIETFVGEMRVASGLALLAIVALAGTVIAEDSVVLQAHRMLQFDSTVFGEAASAALKRGSGKSAMRGTLTRDAAMAESPAAPLLIEEAELKALDAEELLQRAAGGVIVLLPEGGMDADASAAFAKLEAAAVKVQAKGAVYVVPHSHNVTALKELLSRSSSVQVMATADAPAARTGKTSTQVVVLTAEAVKSPPKGRVVAVVAGFDTLGAFPSLPQGAAADVAVLAELAYIFGGQKAAANRGLTFIASSGSRHSYTSLKHWAVGNEGAALVDRADVVLCLEAVTGADPAKLTLHTARDPAKDENLGSLVSALGKVKVDTRRVDPSSTELRWGHEVFSHKGVSAGTLSGQPAKRQALRSSITGTAPTATEIAAVANAIASALSHLTSAELTHKASVERIEKVLKAVGSDPRPSYDMPAKAVSAVQQHLTTAIQAGGPKGKGAPRARRSEFAFAPPEATFYSPDTAVIRAYASKPVAFELTITAVIVGALVGVAVILLGPSGAMNLLSKKKQ